MSIKATLSADSMEEVYSVPTLKELCLYRCLKDKNILTKEADVVEDVDVDMGGKQLEWEKYRLKETIDKKLVEDLLDAGSKHLFQMTPQLEKILAGIRMSQPEHLVKLDLSNTVRLQDYQLEFLLSGGNVEWLDIHASVKKGILNAINKHGGKLEYLRIGDCNEPFISSTVVYTTCVTLNTPNLKTLIVNEASWEIGHGIDWNILLQDAIKNLEELQIRSTWIFNDISFLDRATEKMTKLTLSNCKLCRGSSVWEPLFRLQKLKYLDVTGTRIGEDKLGPTFVSQLLSTMTNLTTLYVDPGVVKNMSIDKNVLCQSSRIKRLDILGVMGRHVDEIEKANILADKVICFGSIENELQVLEYVSNRLNLKWDNPMIEKLLRNINAGTFNWQSVTVLTLLVTILKNNSANIVDPSPFISTVNKLVTSEFQPKIGEVLTDQIVAALCSTLERSAILLLDEDMATITCSVMDILFGMEAKLSFSNYSTAVPLILGITENITVDEYVRTSFSQRLNKLLNRTARLMSMTLVRFLDKNENDIDCRISSVVVIIGELTALSQLSIREELVASIRSMIDNLKIISFRSDKRRKAFLIAGGIEIMFDLVIHFLEGSLKSSHRVIIPLLDIMGSIIQNTTLGKIQFRKMKVCLEKCLFKWKKVFDAKGAKKSDCNGVMKIVISLVRSLENDSRYDYKASADMNKCIKEFSCNL